MTASVTSPWEVRESASIVDQKFIGYCVPGIA